ncbi:MAG: ERCC4 domain-containing protein [Candidatus Bathyarchaeia archaeon]
MSRRIRVIVDDRERPSGVPQLLRKLGLMVDYRMLDVGDYVLPECAVERKEVNDFVKSLYSGRIFDQAFRLQEACNRPVLIVEGKVAPLLSVKMKPQAYWGALTTLSFKYGLRIFFTSDVDQTAALIYALAKRRRVSGLRRPLIIKKPKVDDVGRLQLTIVSMLPGVGPRIADRMLRGFKSVRNVFSATIADLSRVKGLGRAKAEKIAEVLDTAYPPTVDESQQLRLDHA